MRHVIKIVERQKKTNSLDKESGFLLFSLHALLDDK